jgi:methanogenic corrinoid protein MtbC1
MTGVPRNTLLAWERRYGLVRPARLANGYRSYSEGDVALLRQVKALVDHGHAISEAVGLVLAPVPRQPGPTLDHQRARLLDTLLRFDHEGAVRVVAQLGQLPYEQLLDELYLPLLRELGERWAAGTTTVAQEHFASAFVRERMHSMLIALERREATGTTALLACFEGERHDLGLMAAAIRLALRGWRITWLGADVPVDDLIGAVREVEPALVGVAVIHPAPAEALVDAAVSIRAAAPASARVVIGGDGLPIDLDEVDGVEWTRDASALLG